jgi:hypothetical protein
VAGVAHVQSYDLRTQYQFWYSDADQATYSGIP